MKILKFSEESIKFGARRSGFESCSCQMLAVWWSETSILITLALLILSFPIFKTEGFKKTTFRDAMKIKRVMLVEHIIGRCSVSFSLVKRLLLMVYYCHIAQAPFFHGPYELSFSLHRKLYNIPFSTWICIFIPSTLPELSPNNI